MKYLTLLAIIFIQCFTFRAQAVNLLPQVETNIYLGANLSNRLFIIDEDYNFYENNSGKFVRPGVIEEAQKTRESLPAKDFPEGNWGESIRGFQISLRLDKQTYTNGERINTTVLVRDATNHLFVVDYANKVSLGVVNYLVYTPSNTAVASKPEYHGVRSYSHGDEFFIEPDTQLKYMDHLNDTFDLTNGNYLVQASVCSIRTKGTSFETYEIRSAKVPIQIK